MVTRVQHDTSRLVTLEHILTGGAFDAVTELGRARASLGAANAQTRVAAPFLGDWANGVTYVVGAQGSGGTEAELHPVSRSVQVRPATGGTALQVANAVNTARPNGLTQMTATQARNIQAVSRIDGDFKLLGDYGAGTGLDPATAGSVALAGGLAPERLPAGWVRFSAAAGGAGLFIFDSDEPLKLVQFGAALSGAVAWTLTLRPLSTAKYDQGIGLPITNANSQYVLVRDTNVVIPPGWALGFSAAATGRVFASVVRY